MPTSTQMRAMGKLWEDSIALLAEVTQCAKCNAGVESCVWHLENLKRSQGVSRCIDELFLHERPPLPVARLLAAFQQIHAQVVLRQAWKHIRYSNDSIHHSFPLVPRLHIRPGWLCFYSNSASHDNSFAWLPAMHGGREVNALETDGEACHMHGYISLHSQNVSCQNA